MILDTEAFEAAIEEALAALEVEFDRAAAVGQAALLAFDFDPPTAADLEALGRAIAE